MRPFWVLRGFWAVAVLIAMALVVLAMPEMVLDPWKLLDLRDLAKLFVAFGFIQLLGSFLVNRFGERKGRILSGVVSGLVSSTAYTTRAARMSRKRPKESLSRAIGVLGANLGMIAEAVALLAFVDWRLLELMAPTFAALVLGTGLALWGARRAPEAAGDDAKKEDIELNLRTQLMLTLFIGGLLFVVGVGRVWLGTSGTHVVTALSGLMEVHGTLVANAELFRRGALSGAEVGPLLLTGLLMAHLSKVILAGLLGSRVFFVYLGISMSAIGALGAAAFFLF